MRLHLQFCLSSTELLSFTLLPLMRYIISSTNINFIYLYVKFYQYSVHLLQVSQ